MAVFAAGRSRVLASVLALALVAVGVEAQNDGNAGMPWEPLRAASARFQALPPPAQKTEPFKLFENVSYVGLETVAAYLIPTKAGLILIDATYADTADLVLDNIRKLGHDPAQLKHIVVTHAHPDHAGGAARIKQVTGARVMMARADWEHVERTQGGAGAPALAREDVINDGDKLTLGEVELWFYVIGGHAPGNVATEIHGLAGGREFRTLLGVDFAPVAGTTAASIQSIERLKELGPWDALLPAHPFLAPVAVPAAVPATARQILAGERLPPYPTKQVVAVGAQRVNAYLDEIRAALQKRLASEQRR